MDDPEAQQKAGFNEAVSGLNRLNILLTSCDQSSISLDVYSWFHSMLAIFRELSIYMKDDESIELEKSIGNMNSQVSQAYSKINRTGKIEISSELYMELHHFELKLRKIANKAGLLMRMADDAMDALR